MLLALSALVRGSHLAPGNLNVNSKTYVLVLSGVLYLVKSGTTTKWGNIVWNAISAASRQSGSSLEAIAQEAVPAGGDRIVGMTHCVMPIFIKPT